MTKINFKYIPTKDYPMWGYDLPKLEQHVYKWIPSTVFDAETRVYKYLYDGRPIPPFGEEYNQLFDTRWQIQPEPDQINDLGKAEYVRFKPF